MFIDTFYELCEKHRVSPNKACIDMGISRTSTAKWKSGSVPNGQTLSKIADYFGVTTDFLLGTETKKEPLTVFGEELPEDVLQNEKVLRAMKAFMKVPPELQDHLLATIEGLAESRK